jgi:hypothetical protein
MSAENPHDQGFDYVEMRAIYLRRRRGDIGQTGWFSCQGGLELRDGGRTGGWNREEEPADYRITKSI